MVTEWGVVFDLDDTLYLERDYVRSGFRHVARLLARAVPVETEQTLFSFLWHGFEAGERRGAFERLLNRYPRLRRAATEPHLVAEYRSHQPYIEPFPFVHQTLDQLSQAGARLALISDGCLASQTAKWAALQLGDLFQECVFTDAWGAGFWKPHARGYKRVEAAFALPPSSLVYVADNPAKDFVTPRALGWHTVRLRAPGQIHVLDEPATPEHAAEREIGGLECLSPLLVGELLQGNREIGGP